MIFHLHKSVKNLGRYELTLMNSLEKFYKSKGFAVATHIRLNLAWSNIYSDIDMLLLKKDELSVIEIKSNRDKLSNAIRQIEKIKDYIDYIYIATEKIPAKWDYEDVGLLLADSKKVQEIIKPTKMLHNPRNKTIDMFQKKCLIRTLWKTRSLNFSLRYKDDVVRAIYEEIDPLTLRNYLKKIAICDYDCDNNCPIKYFE